jgi:hypothetical protein
MPGEPRRVPPASGERPGNEGFHIAIIDPYPPSVLMRVAKDIREGERALIVSQEHVLVSLIGIPKLVVSIVEANRLSAFGQCFHQMAKHVVVQISNKPRHSFNRTDFFSDHYQIIDAGLSVESPMAVVD